MEIIILGLLIIQKCTIYEIRKRIEKNFTSMSSNSMGSIQSAIKKLLNNSMITYNEFVENSVNKKVYEITDEGKAYFIDSVSKPMRYKEKNMELSKLFFMGFTPQDIRIELIRSYISELEGEKAKLEQIRISTQDSETNVANYIDYLEDSGTLDQFTEMFQSKSVIESVRDIALFQYATLELSIAKMDFEISWFEEFKNKLEKTKREVIK